MTKHLELQLLQEKQRQRLQASLETLRHAVHDSVGNYENFKALQQKAKNWKWESIENLEKYLVEFEGRLQQSGAQIIWAKDADEARKAIQQIHSQGKFDTTLVSRSNELSEIEIETHFQNLGLGFQNTDIGQDIATQLKMNRRHPVYPLLEKDSRDLRKELNKGGYSLPELLSTWRKESNKKQSGLTLSITGADFLIADKGTIVNCSTEGDASWSSSLADTQVVVSGIEKVLPNMQALMEVLPVYASYQFGKANIARTLLRRGNKFKEGKLILILIDNGRTELLANPNFREALYDLEGSSFILDCPIYQNISGQHYGALIPGPLGAVLTSLLYKEKDFVDDPSFYSCLEENLSSNPFLIDLRRMIVNARSRSMTGQGKGTMERYFWDYWEKAMLDRDQLDGRNNFLKKSFRRLMSKFIAGKTHTPEFAPKSFAQLWEERRIAFK